MTKKNKSKNLPERKIDNVTTIKLKEESLIKFSGSESKEFSTILANQAVNTVWLKSSDEDKTTQSIGCIHAMMGFEPKDAVEGMMTAQMVALHNAVMECFRRAMVPEQTIEGRENNLRYGNKCAVTFSAMLDALSRYRGNVSEQKMTVEHVHVHSGGQAIVGNVSNKEGGGKAINLEQAHAK